MHRRYAPLALVGLALLAGTADGQSRTGGSGGQTGGGMFSGGTGGTGSAGTGGAQGDSAGGGAAGGGEIGGLLADPASAFSIQRGGAIGGADESAAPVGASTGAAGTAATGVGARGGAFGGGFGGMGGLGGLGGLFGGLNPFGMGGGNEQSTPVRTRLRSGVRAAPVPPQQVQARIQQQLVNTPAGGRFIGTQVRMDGRTAILSGQVRSEEDRRMAELLIRLEPGVSRIENNLEVGPPETVPPPSPSDAIILSQP